MISVLAAPHRIATECGRTPAGNLAHTLLRAALAWGAGGILTLACAQAGGQFGPAGTQPAGSQRSSPSTGAGQFGPAGAPVAGAQRSAPPSGVGQFGPGGAQLVGPPERTVSEWLVRLQQASRWPAYAGTFVVSSASGALSSARIWHVCEGDTQIERVESLTGAPRLTYRRNDSVVTFFPQTRVMQNERRESNGAFPSLLNSSEEFETENFYSARQHGHGRVAGFDADIVQLLPLDELRFGYRIWSEKRTGLVVKMQTLASDGRVLEQVAFSELQLDAPLSMDKLKQMMAQTDGYRLEKSDKVKTTATSEGWSLKSPVPGFSAQSCYRKSPASASRMVQWIFSDGLATVSLFMEPFNRERHVREGQSALGATHTLTKRLADKTGDWWVTAVGEVPMVTLKAFTDSLERKN
ncbi:MucB/RseB C-terminal domain-containing protein [Ottowia thiooxydans]|uniref:Sigma-E factor negative regulatory protein RseB n=1 Tax=Ottowia thiooxydans TaxID=219182 RepID=A0ABV2Q604_9BURK